MAGGRGAAIGLVGMGYAVALGVAVAVGGALSGSHPLVVVALADLVGTLVIFGFSRAFDNSSFYDPYWSVAPVPIALYWLVLGGASGAPVRQWLVLGLVAVWGVRLTWNWLRGWSGLSHEDWRYEDLRERHGRAYWLVSLAGIHVFPTLLVYLGCVALWPALTSGGEGVGWLDGLAALVTVGGIAVEAIADEQLRRFRDRGVPRGKTLASGLWALSRHPNYFGEITFWWGLALFGLAASGSAWWVLIGPVAMTLLFVFISIPMIDRRMLARRPDYGQRMKRVSALVPWFPRNGDG